MTTKREEWTLNEASGEIKDEVGNIVADVTRARIGRRIAAVPDYEAALLETALRLDPGDALPCWCKVDDFCAHDEGCQKARAALRKGGWWL